LYGLVNLVQLNDSTAFFTVGFPNGTQALWKTDGTESGTVSVATFSGNQLSVIAAWVAKMELLGHNFFVYRNAETDEVNVVYKRKGNTYGLIEPEI
jgi:ELWxxDGT repeat protein